MGGDDIVGCQLQRERCSLINVAHRHACVWVDRYVWDVCFGFGLAFGSLEDWAL